VVIARAVAVTALIRLRTSGVKVVAVVGCAEVARERLVPKRPKVLAMILTQAKVGAAKAMIMVVIRASGAQRANVGRMHLGKPVQNRAKVVAKIMAEAVVLVTVHWPKLVPNRAKMVAKIMPEAVVLLAVRQHVSGASWVNVGRMVPASKLELNRIKVLVKTTMEARAVTFYVALRNIEGHLAHPGSLP
jgi:hypothetical protein